MSDVSAAEGSQEDQLVVDVPEINRVVVGHRMVQAGLLLTLIWKWSFFVEANRVYGAIPLEDPFFPALLRSVWTVRVMFVAAVGASALNLVTASRTLQRICAWVCLLSTTVLCIHQASYNDMTFVTAWWVSVWAVWYVHRIDDEDQEKTLRRAAFLSRIILSVILLGGGIGKWTAEYWSGAVLYDIYFVDRDFWLFNALRAMFEANELQTIAKWYSRLIIVTETAAGIGLWILPARWAAIVGVVLLTAIIVLSNTYLTSVLACLIGLAAIGFLPQRAFASPRTPR